ncbi:MAG: hypothetical protein IJS19_02165 [Muribaculaceae bacterium]|nr:hypothetical protein [Muribaculaceae bacterium]
MLAIAGFFLGISQWKLQREMQRETPFFEIFFEKMLPFRQKIVPLGNNPQLSRR